MNPTSKWGAIHEALVERSERMAPEPPTAEELLAYRRRELAPEDEARVRELLVAYPELARAIAQTVPPEEPRPGDPDYVSAPEFDRRRAALRKRIHKTHREAGRVLQFFQVSTAIAATLALAFGVLLWKARSELGQPRVAWEEQVLRPDGRRGATEAGVMLAARGESVLLIVPVLDPQQFPSYRLEMRDVQRKRTVWNSVARRRDNDTFVILVPRNFLDPGKYQIILYGVGDDRPERIASYSLRVPRG